MTGDKGNFLNFKEERGGNVYFGDNGSTKIIGKGMFSLGTEGLKQTMSNKLRISSVIFSV